MDSFASLASGDDLTDECFPDITPLEFSLHFTSFFAAIRRLKNNPYAAGTLVARLSCVAHVLLLSTANATDEEFQIAKDSSAAYIQRRGGVYIPISYEDTRMVVNELIECLGEINNSYSQPTSSTDDTDGLFLRETAEYFTYKAKEVAYEYLEYLQASFLGVVEDGWTENMDLERADKEILEPFRWLESIPVSTTAVQYEPDHSVTEFQPTGPPIARNEYCTPYNEDEIPEGGECAICLGSFSEMDLVVANCPSRHVFHGDCLELQVNESAMLNSNRCALDRHEIGPARQRSHPMVLG